MSWGDTNFNDLFELEKKLNDMLKDNDILLDISKELTGRLLGKVIPRTPVGQYPPSSGKVGGTLRRGWTVSSGTDTGISATGDVANYIDGINVSGDIVEIYIINPVEYAVYVEHGTKHMEGRHMLTISTNELQNESPQVITNILHRKLREVFG